MDNLLKLFKNKEYKILLEKLSKLEEDHNNYYPKIILKAKTLIKIKKLKAAYKIIKKELSMPYIPSKYENDFHKIKTEILAHIENPEQITVISKENLEKILFHNFDESKILIAMSNISKLNLKPYLTILNKYLIWKKGDDNIKSIIMFTLKNANVSGCFKVFKNNIEYTFEPTKLVNTDELECFKIATEIIDQVFFQEISKQEMANYLLFVKLFKMAPAEISKSQIKPIAMNIIKKVKTSFA